MPSYTDNPVPRQPRATRRGAIFVEAIIIIASFTLMLMGLIFFHRLYLISTDLNRLSRGAAIAYSMGGCEHNPPHVWLNGELGGYTTNGTPPPANKETIPGNENPQAEGEEADRVNGINHPAMKDGIALNPMVQTEVAGRAHVSRKKGLVLTTTTAIFEKHLTGRSTVSCGDVVRNGSYSEAIGYVKDLLDEVDW